VKSNDVRSQTLAICFGQFGPYHHARVAALQDAAFVGGEPHKRHFASLGIPAEKIFTGYDAVDGDFFAQRADEIRAAAKKSVQFSVFSVQQEERADEVRTPSSPRARSGGQDLPEAEDLSTLISQPSTGQSVRSAYGLPQRYFLSLGRMVEKKNLATLVSAYARYAQGVAVAGEKLKVKGHDVGDLGAGSSEQGGAAADTRHLSLVTCHSPASLVFVGSGELENSLREQARGLGLKVIDRTEWKVGQSGHSRACETAEGKLTRINTDKSERLAADRTEGNAASPVTRAGCEGPQSQAEPRLCETGLSQNCKL